MRCPHCNSGRMFSSGQLATCAACGRFVHPDRDAIEQAFDKVRVGMTDAETAQERETRERCFGSPSWLGERDLE